MAQGGRPVSRGLGPMGGLAPPGGPGGGVPPGTATRQGTAMRGIPPGTAARLNTRQGTAMRGTAAQGQTIGVGAHAEVKVSDRPMTMHGLSGMKTGSLGPKRQVYDKSYYLGELRKRCTDLQDEVEKMNTEAEEVRKDNQLYTSLEKRYDQLVKTVRLLEGDLADHNLATDKQRTDTQPEDVHHMYRMMKEQNDQLRAEVDQIFLEKKSHEEEIQRLHEEILSLARAAEERLNELHPDQHREYDMLQEENGTLANELSECRDENDQITERLLTLEGHLRSDVFRMRAQQLQEARQEAAERMEVLEAEARQGSLSIPEQRDLLLAKVKSDNADIVAAEKRNSELKLEREKLKAQIQEVTTDAQTSADMQSDQQKYEILFTKDQEMTQFIESFDKVKGEESEKMAEKQARIKQLLESISSTMALTVSADHHMKDVEDELDFKSRHLQNAEVTQNRLEAELNKRQGELEKIETLDTKISQELQQVETKMQSYNDEISNKFDKVQDMQANGNEQLKAMGERRAVLDGRLTSLRQQLSFLKLKHDSRKQQLADDECAQGLEAQEQKIRQFGQTLHTLRTFIWSKTAESNYDGELNSCMELTGQLNKMHVERRLVLN
mmetsp:Transcript_134528/g.335648  ORF Transcript_134528/g.335648 Transcript_134528/m.335648 type:complete len:611 (+) Transcript_134528:93-1925(+)|eukprot:CAMPEP_0115233398 /NCGR_PEP_ID=MMETSP0270-20121206/34255_1 /TAXON_ID=71861 /ORGANISM="Scrippsiella trochoidea, Strain CCMP3099" /LENGTH=610 /DNA_ID=CAMNT_0002648109 /DNA_START=20 /DNA_END=1852 /DNA_ORIENTATION=-